MKTRQISQGRPCSRDLFTPFLALAAVVALWASPAIAQQLQDIGVLTSSRGDGVVNYTQTIASDSQQIPFSAPAFTVSNLPLGTQGSVSPPTGGLVINPTFDSSLGTNLSPADVTNVMNAFNYAAQQFQNNFHDNIQINITVAAVAGTGTLGSSNTNLLGFQTYSQMRTALINDATTPDDATSTASLGATDPTSGTQANILYARAQAKALGLIASDSSTDGTFTFGAGYSYTYDPNNRAVSGKIDFIGVAEHEISEIMGRIPSLGTNFGNGVPDYLPFDFFRYTAASTRNFVNGGAAGVYFSIDGGNTNLKNFNNPAGNGSDPQDWASGSNDAFNAFSSSGVKNDVSTVDLQTLDAIGYDRTLTPEPASGVLMLGAGAMLLLRRRLAV